MTYEARRNNETQKIPKFFQNFEFLVNFWHRRSAPIVMKLPTDILGCLIELHKKSPTFLAQFQRVLWLSKTGTYDFGGTFNHFWGTKRWPICTKFIVEIVLIRVEYCIKFQVIRKKNSMEKVVANSKKRVFLGFFLMRF